MTNQDSIATDGFYLRQEFIIWLVEEQHFTPGSANSYASYVAMANKNIFVHHLDEPFFKIINESVQQGDNDGVEELIDLLIGSDKSDAQVSVLNKYRNGVIQYRNFLIEKLSEDVIIDDGEPEIEPAVQLTKTYKATALSKKIPFPQCLTYDADSLKKIFFFRMITQDRCYGKVYFPVRFLKQLFYKNQPSRLFFNEYIGNQINNIQLHTNSGAIRLSDIKSLAIKATSYDESDVTVVLNNDSSVLLYTKLATGNDLTRMTTSSLKQIAIDHVFPMKKILGDEEKNLPVLKLITETFRASDLIKRGKRISDKMMKNIGNQLLKNEVFNANDVEQLKTELNHIQKFIQLQLMDSTENLLKKAKYEAG